MICRASVTAFAEIVETPTLPMPAQIRHLVLGKRPDCIDIVRTVFSSRIADPIVRSIPKRQYEFLLGRLAAWILLIENGVPVEDSWIQSSVRKPVWPCGIIGSISHSKDLVAVSLSSKGCGIDSIGIDIESFDQDAEVIMAIAVCFTSNERVILEQIENGLIIGFAVKEALYKCLNPISGIFFDFLDVEIRHVDTNSQHIDLALHCNLGPTLKAGTSFRGTYQRFSNHVWAGVSWRATKDMKINASAFEHAKEVEPIIVEFGSMPIS